MLQIRKAGNRGVANFGWLDSRHTFSFGEYHHPEHMGFGPLRVINEDRIAPGAGFPPHPHRDMEIISYVLGGQLAHKDNMGNGSTIQPGDVQRMSAGRGVLHSEFNPSSTDPVHFLQIWIEPAQRGVAPSYEQGHVAPHDMRGRLALIAGPQGSGATVTIHQDARLYAARLDHADALSHALASGRRAYVHVARGTVRVNGVPLATGDAVRIEGESQVALTEGTDAEVLLFDLN